MMRSRLKASPVALQIPWGTADAFQGVIDLVGMAGIYYETESLGARFERVEIPAEHLDRAVEMRAKMVEAVAETDDRLLEKYLSGDEIEAAELAAALRKATIASRLQPVLCGSAFKNKGVQPLLDAVVGYLPSPVEVPAVEGTGLDGVETLTRKPSYDEPLSALVFKIINDLFVGQLYYFRVYSGRLASGEKAFNAT
jgi:elongation factor G